MPTIQAQDIVNAAIQDSQSQTTNRTALYDYTDRIHQRILRESRWRFLLSDPQTFVTLPGVSGYTLVSGSPVAGAFQTNLNLSNFANIAKGSVYNLTGWQKIEEDEDEVTTRNSLINRDGSLRTGFPRTYANSISNPGTIYLKPAPDGQNQYFPVPETPVVTSAPLAGCNLPSRIYFGVVTFVDNLNGESAQCSIPFTIAVPAGNVVTVSSPNGTLGGIAGNQTFYGYWNLYMGYSIGLYNRQNVTPLVLGSSWTENILGINPGVLQVPSALNLPPGPQGSVLSITHTGLLGTSVGSVPLIPFFWALKDASNNLWQVSTDGTGHLTTTSIPSSPAFFNVFPVIYLTDATNQSTWAITVSTGGLLIATLYSTPPSTIAVNGNPPQTPTIQPLNAYVIQFRYYMTRNSIVNPTDVLQIPYTYKDIVIAGVNYLASMYMDIQANREPSAKTILWRKDFDSGLAQIRRDLRVSFGKTDFISPDISSQYVVANQQGIPTMGW